MENTKESKVEEFDDSFFIDGRYKIYKSDGCVYDTDKAEDIPQYIFELRDNKLLKKITATKLCKNTTHKIHCKEFTRGQGF